MSADRRAGLEAERAATVEQIASLEREHDRMLASSELVATDDEHDPEGHTIAWEREQLTALVRSARAHVAELDEALARLEGGSYGTCEVCGGPIAAERLDALPTVRTCIVCAR